MAAPLTAVGESSDFLLDALSSLRSPPQVVLWLVHFPVCLQTWCGPSEAIHRVFYICAMSVWPHAWCMTVPGRVMNLMEISLRGPVIRNWESDLNSTLCLVPTSCTLQKATLLGPQCPLPHQFQWGSWLTQGCSLPVTCKCYITKGAMPKNLRKYLVKDGKWLFFTVGVHRTLKMLKLIMAFQETGRMCSP